MMSGKQWFAALIVSLVPLAAHAEWQPQWRSQWQPKLEEPLVSVVNVQTDALGNAFAAVFARPHFGPHEHLATVRFDTDGTIAWATIGPVVDQIAPLVLLADQRVATSGRGNDGTSFLSVLQVRDPDTGALLVDKQTVIDQQFQDVRYVLHSLTETSGGNLVIRTQDPGGVNLLRYDASGNALPAWRWECDGARGLDLVALDDDGVALSGTCHEPQGYHIVRFKGDGEVAFVDIEEGGTFSNVAVAEQAPDDSLLVATTMTPGGFLTPTIWKVLSNGSRAWSTEVPVTSGNQKSSEIFRMRFARNGDIIVAIDQAILPMAVARVDGDNGAVLWNVAVSESGFMSDGSLAEAPNGRILTSGHFFESGTGTSNYSITELTAEGALCRHRTLGPGGRPRIAADDSGWTVVHPGRLDPEQENIALVAERYDATGPCEADPIFADGFEV